MSHNGPSHLGYPNLLKTVSGAGLSPASASVRSNHWGTPPWS